MPAVVFPGVPYRSKQALERARALVIGDQVPHATPDGVAVVALHAGGSPPVALDGRPAAAASPPCWHVLRSDGLNLEHVATVEGRLVVQTVRIPLDGLGDVERLVEYDHLPEARKDYSAYPRGHKLA